MSITRALPVLPLLPVACCPVCGTALDGGPVLFHCATCHRGVYAADVPAACPEWRTAA